MTFFIALGVLVAAATAYLLRQFAAGTLANDGPTLDIAEDAPHEAFTPQEVRKAA